jgi:L-histidine Nalpha-methyltransferase
MKRSARGIQLKATEAIQLQLAMQMTATVHVHPSQFPERVRAQLKECLRTRVMNHKFHYESIKQTARWLAVHQAYAPFVHDPHCQDIYARAAVAAVELCPAGPAQVVGMGCGSGLKDRLVLEQFRKRSERVSYVPVDVGTAMVLTARNNLMGLTGSQGCHPIVCDLPEVNSLKALLNEVAPSAGPRLMTFYGMLPNFEPGVAARVIAPLLRPGNLLLLSANLAPGPNYSEGLRKILPLYANRLTQEWLMTVLTDLGISPEEGVVEIRCEAPENEMKLGRIGAHFRFLRDRTLAIEEETFQFSADETIQLFFSYRHTPNLVGEFLAAAGGKVLESWISPSEEEGVFLCAGAGQ